MSDTDTMNIKYYEKFKAYAISESIGGKYYDQVVIDTGIHKSKYHWADVYWYIKIKANSDNIAIVYIMVAYELKVMNY